MLRTRTVFDRDILQQLRNWRRKPSRKPLILRGARQVGKTTAVRMLAREFDSFIEINLERPGEAGVFRRGLAPERLLQAIELDRGIGRIQPAQTLLFLDEIQACPQAMPYLRYLYEDMPQLGVIAGGSLLEAMIERNRLELPVGRIEYLRMYPLCFHEFLAAIGEKRAAEAVDTVPGDEVARPKLMDLFHSYALIGGMPEAVARYAEEPNIATVDEIYDELMTALCDDVPRYAPNSSLARVLRHCIETAPLVTGQRIKFAGFGNSNYGSREIGEALRLLERAMILHLLYPVTGTELPLVANTRKSPRLQFLDIGLVNHYAGLQKEYFSLTDLHSLARGAILEQVVGQEMLASGLTLRNKPAFWVREKKPSSAEVDFVVQLGGKAIPVEVKSGKTGTLRSLHQFMDRCDHDMAVRLYAGPLQLTPCRTIAGKPFRLLNLPYYLAGRVAEHVEWAFGG